MDRAAGEVDDVTRLCADVGGDAAQTLLCGVRAAVANYSGEVVAMTL